MTLWWVPCVCCALAADPQISAAPVALPATTSIQETSPQRATSQRFQVFAPLAQPRAKEVVQVAEALRVELETLWFGEAPADRWSPPCEVVLHGTAAQYAAAIGQPGSRSRGSTVVRFEQGQLVLRRIDLLADEPGRALGALRHELLHVLFANRFGELPPPRWVEEGAALLGDSPEKQRLHERDLRAAWQSRQLLPVRTLMADRDYPSAAAWATFYGQSASLVRFLAARKEPHQLTRFITRAQQVGERQALAEVYQISSVAELERQWLQTLATTAVSEVHR